MSLIDTNKFPFSFNLGLYFQIRDDYCNLSLKEYSENKSFCEDLTEGKFSFPIIHAIQTGETNPLNLKHEDQQVLREYLLIDGGSSRGTCQH